METIIEDDMLQESAQALQSGHSCHSENHVYRLSPKALAGAGEDVLPLFLDASTDWQMACKMIPGGHLLPYDEAKASNFASLTAEKKIKANYTTLIQTMEQVMDQMMLTLDSQLEKHTSTLIEHMDKRLDELIEINIKSVF